MSPKLVFVILAVLALKANADTAATDVLTPANGHELFGTLKSVVGDQVIFETDSGAVVSLPWNQVKQIHTHQRLSLAGVPTDHAKKITLEAQAASNVQWTGSITPKFSLATGTQTVQTFGGQLYLKRTQGADHDDWQHQETTLTLEANNSLTEQAGSPSIRIHAYDGAFGHSVYLKGGLFVRARAEAYHNTALNLYLQQMYGGGLGMTVISTKHASLELLGDGLFVAEHFYGAPGTTFAAVRLGERAGLRLGMLKGGPIIVAQGLSYIPAVQQAKAWQIRGVSQLSAPVTKTIGFNFNFSDDYLENAPNGRKNYSSSSVGISFQFGP